MKEHARKPLPKGRGSWQRLPPLGAAGRVPDAGLAAAIGPFAAADGTFPHDVSFSTANREAIRAAGMSDAALEWNYVHGTSDPALIDPDSWLLQSTLLNRPGNKDAMLDLLYDYRTSPGLYPLWHDYFRAHQPPTLITWGGNDEIFTEAGAHPYRNDLPQAEIVILDAGHFALEDHADVIARHISRFTSAHALSGARGATTTPAPAA